ncbi:MAG: undecaprenyl-diphosphate phosphatase [Firmicutes bacterium]|nr:undecaprenyl-diphosphate phosphatase [Bacillota bacterium]
MTILEAIIIGLVQGLTEFLPISSSGHMLLMGRLLGVEVSLGLELFMHIATLLAVLIALRKEVFSCIKKPLSKPTLLIITATIPTVLIVLLFQSFFVSAFDGRFLAYCFLITAILLTIASMIKPKTHKQLTTQLKNTNYHESLKSVSFIDASIIGIVQGFAVLPGLSRSGSTISTGVILGNEKTTIARFSFLISIPIIIGSSILELSGNGLNMAGTSVLPLIFGFLAAFISGYFAIKFMLKKLLLSFNMFAIYLTALSIFMFLDMFILGWL